VAAFVTLKRAVTEKATKDEALAQSAFDKASDESYRAGDVFGDFTTPDERSTGAALEAAKKANKEAAAEIELLARGLRDNIFRVREAVEAQETGAITTWAGQPGAFGPEF